VEPYHNEAGAARIVAVCGEIIFRNDANGYTVANFASQSKLIDSFTGVGVMPFLDSGETVVLFGKWTDHSVYGRQFLVDRFAPHRAASEKDLIRYLSSDSIPWVGPKTAQKIVARFGTNALDVIREDPDKLTEIRGMTPKKAREISAVLRQKGDFQELALLLTPFGFGSARIMSVYKRFGSSAHSILRKNPYLLVSEISGIGFLTADKVARSMGYDPASPFRVGSAILYLLTVSENDGNTYAPMDSLMRRTLQLLEDSMIREDAEDPADSALAFNPEEPPAGLKSSGNAVGFSPEKPSEILRIGTDQLIQGLIFLLNSAKIFVYRTEERDIIEYDRIIEITSDLRVALPRTFESEISAAHSLIKEKARGGGPRE
jgi:ATP-dependent exoDNAse (exonuclease V) alpha subunit